MDKYPLPVPVLDPEKRSKVAVDEKHGLWGFFRPDKKALNTPEETAAFGRPWVVEELRHKSWEDLHSLWWICCKERNLLATQAYERDRLKAGYGEAEILDRNRAVRQTQKAIKHALTERYYAFEDARRVAVVDSEVDLEAEPGTQAYTPIYSDKAGRMSRPNTISRPPCGGVQQPEHQNTGPSHYKALDPPSITLLVNLAAVSQDPRNRQGGITGRGSGCWTPYWHDEDE
ncbi:MAG: hypothetical protein L6R42_001977 [Xanthoria sp. 1 TBL-2021]|nr:MAG: hypothetical protein L6R42_001977 [Xanthoria sp. 1 TBL-2021]